MSADVSVSPSDLSTRLARARNSSAAARAAALIVLAIGVAALLWANRGSWFYLDDWDFAILRHDLNEQQLMYPQNQNLVATTLLFYQALLRVFGMASYVPFRLAAVAVVALIGWLVYTYSRRRIGPWWALIPLGAVMLSPGWEIVLWPFQVGQLFSVAAGLGVLVLLDLSTSRRALAGAAALLVFAVASSSAGIPILGLVLLNRVLRAGKRLQALIVVPAALFYAWWMSAWAHLTPNPNPSTIEAYRDAVRSALNVGDGALQGVLGLYDWPAAGSLVAHLALLALIVFICWRLFTPGRTDRVRILALVGALGAYWVLLAWGRANVPDFWVSARYIYLSHVLLLLLLVELASSVLAQIRAAEEPWFRTAAARPLITGTGVAVVAIAAFASFQNAQTLKRGGDHLRQQGEAARGQAAALALQLPSAQPHVPFYLDAAGMGLGRGGAQYFTGLELFGTDPFTEAELREMSPQARAYADRWMLALATPALAAGAQPPAPIDDAPGVTAPPEVRTAAKSRGACTKTSADADTATVSLETPPVGPTTTIANLADTPLQLRGRRYADALNDTAVITIAPGETRPLMFGGDTGTAPWELTLTGRSALVCNTAAAG